MACLVTFMKQGRWEFNPLNSTEKSIDLDLRLFDADGNSKTHMFSQMVVKNGNSPIGLFME